MSSHMPSSDAPSPTLNRNRRLPSPVKQPSAATNPPMKLASASVPGRTVVMAAAQAASAHRLVAAGLGTRARPLAVLARVREFVLDQRVSPSFVLRALRRWEQVPLHERNGC